MRLNGGGNGVSGQIKLPQTASAKAKEPVDDPNRPETEEDGFRAEALRRLKVRLSSRAPQDPTQTLSLSRSNMLPTTASTSVDKPVTQK
jgi:hypothetical protein